MGRRPFRPSKRAFLRRIDSWLAHTVADAEFVRDMIEDGVMDKLIADVEAIRARFRALHDDGGPA